MPLRKIGETDVAVVALDALAPAVTAPDSGEELSSDIHDVETAVGVGMPLLTAAAYDPAAAALVLAAALVFLPQLLSFF